MIRVRTGSRLHFGLFSVPSLELSGWPTQEAKAPLFRRRFGGVGMMINQPGIAITVDFAKRWSAEGPVSQRALHFARTYCEEAGVSEAVHLSVESAGPEHAGLGSGTQLGLAVARSIAELTGQPARRAIALAGLVRRGVRSAIGVHGFDQGGLIVEGGKESTGVLSPLLVRIAVPDTWRILLITPRDLVGIHGQREALAFARMENEERDSGTTETLCRLVLLNLLPALVEGNLDAFGAAIYDFNRRVGEMFEVAQGGIYAHPQVESIVKRLRDLGIQGVGQSSWGPAVFAIADACQVESAKDRLVQEKLIAPDEATITNARNKPATVESA